MPKMVWYKMPHQPLNHLTESTGERMQYKVQITNTALTDMEEIYNYIATQLLSPENAINQYNRIADEILKLNILPDRYPIYKSFSRYDLPLHRMAVDNYSVFYIIQASTVIVTNVLYSASNLTNKL